MKFPILYVNMINNVRFFKMLYRLFRQALLSDLGLDFLDNTRTPTSKRHEKII